LDGLEGWRRKAACGRARARACARCRVRWCGNGCSAVDAAAVEGVGALAVAAAAVSAGVCVVGVERAGGVDDAVAVPAIVDVTVETRGRRGVSDVGGDVGVAVAVASGSVHVVVEARGQQGVSDVGGIGLGGGRGCLYGDPYP